MNLHKLCRAAPLALAIAACAFAETALAQDGKDSVTIYAPANESYVVKYSMNNEFWTNRLLEVTMAKRVRFSDLNLQRSEDVKELKRRLKAAAYDVCTNTSLHFPSFNSPVQNFNECHRDALSDAESQLDRAIARSRLAKNNAAESGG